MSFCCSFVVESADIILGEEGLLTDEEDLDHLVQGWVARVLGWVPLNIADNTGGEYWTAASTGVI